MYTSITMNFEKSLPEFTEAELHQKINQTDPRFGILASYELLRRLALKNDESSRRFARWSLIIAVAAIVISLLTSLVQIWLAWPR